MGVLARSRAEKCRFGEERPNKILRNDRAHGKCAYQHLCPVPRNAIELITIRDITFFHSAVRKE